MIDATVVVFSPLFLMTALLAGLVRGFVYARGSCVAVRSGGSGIPTVSATRGTPDIAVDRLPAVAVIFAAAC